METKWLPIESLVPNADNPNEQDERTFNATVASIAEEGWLQPCASVVDLGNGTYEIVGGQHRWEAARVLGHETVPCWMLDPEKFGKDRRDWSLMKMNIISGKVNPAKFARMYERLVKVYDAETLQALMGFTTTDAFQKVYRTVRDALPPELRDALAEVKDEIRTIDDLSLVLNRLFREHGETLPSDFMVFSWGGKEVLWVRLTETQMRDFKGWGAETDGSFAADLHGALSHAKQIERDLADA